jgi:hypothetical protein
MSVSTTPKPTFCPGHLVNVWLGWRGAHSVVEKNRETESLQSPQSGDNSHREMHKPKAPFIWALSLHRSIRLGAGC